MSLTACIVPTTRGGTPAAGARAAPTAVASPAMSPAGDASNDRSGAARARRVWGIVVAGGAGRRFGSAKQFARLGGGTVLERSLAAARGAVDAAAVGVPAEPVREPGVAGLGADAVVRGGGTVLERSRAAARGAVDAVVVVVPAEHVGEPEVAGLGADAVVAGGATRADSVRAGLAAVPGDAEVVLVHDAARPLASTELFERVRDAVLGGAGAVVPVVPVVDTIRHVDGGVVDRDQLRAVQTPQGF